MPNLHTLMKMLRFKRPMASRTEHNFRKYFLLNLPDAWEDVIGNIHVIVSRPDGSWPITVWSSHTDTVHDNEGLQDIRLKQGKITLLSGSSSNCLGADCTVGVWIMREMIQAGVPGHYVFHYGEERGCIGSSHLVKKYPKYFKGARCVIAFDRRGHDEIITFQRSKRTCSEAFAASLAAMLPKGYKASPNGIYTDSAEYAGLVPECTNLSVGYKHEHSDDEELMLYTPLKLVNAIIQHYDETRLVIERDPTKTEYKTVEPYKGTVYGYAGYYNKDTKTYGKSTKVADVPKIPATTGKVIPATTLFHNSTYQRDKNGCIIVSGSKDLTVIPDTEQKLHPDEEKQLAAWLEQEQIKQDEEDRKRIEAIQASVCWYDSIDDDSTRTRH